MASVFDKIDRFRFDLQRINRDYANQAKYIGSERDDGALRRKLAMARERFNTTCHKIDTAMKQQDATGADKGSDMWRNIMVQIQEQKAEFEQMDREVQQKERQNPLAGMGGRAAGDITAADDDSRFDGSATVSGGGIQSQIQGLKQIDMTELNLEENIQREKLEAVVQIEQDVNEIKSMYSEFNDHLEIQQPKLDVIETNVEKSTTRVEGGVVHLQQAQQSQKSSRKKTCCLLFLLLIGVALAIGLFLIFKWWQSGDDTHISYAQL